MLAGSADRRRLDFQPGPDIRRHQRADRPEDRRMIVVEPIKFGVGEQRGIDQHRIDWRHRDRLEPEHRLHRARDVSRDGNDKILDPDAIIAPFVISGLVRQDYRSEEHTSELQSLMTTSYAVFFLKNNKD